MNRLLLVGADPARTGALARALAREGFAVKVAPEGLYALTLLEREGAGLLLLDGAAGDLPAEELAAIVRSDPALAGLELVLAVRSPAPAPGGFDLVVDGDLPPAELAAAVRRGALDRRLPGAVALSGSLDALDLLQLTGTLGQRRRTGRLSLVLPGERVGEIYLDRGLVVHALFGAAEGRSAFTRVVAAVQGAEEIFFAFEILTREEVFRYPRTLAAEVQRLLLNTVAELEELHRRDGRDHRRTG
jgi:CheY-like chemotaxis protein